MIVVPYLVIEVSNLGNKLIVSVGHKIERMKKLFLLKKQKLEALHCVSIYPNSLEKCNINKSAIKEVIGKINSWSDHSKFEDCGQHLR